MPPVCSCYITGHTSCESPVIIVTTTPDCCSAAIELLYMSAAHAPDAPDAHARRVKRPDETQERHTLRVLYISKACQPAHLSLCSGQHPQALAAHLCGNLTLNTQSCATHPRDLRNVRWSKRANLIGCPVRCAQGQYRVQRALPLSNPLMATASRCTPTLVKLQSTPAVFRTRTVMDLCSEPNASSWKRWY